MNGTMNGMMHGTMTAPRRGANVWAFVLLMVLTGAGAALNALTFVVYATVTPASVAIGAGLMVLLTGVAWFLLSRSKLWRPAGAWPLLAVAWGAFGAFVFSVLNGEAMTTIATATGWEAAEASLAGAWPEEVGKTAGVALILLAAHRIWNRPWDGLLVGMLVGVGFELIENVQYGAAGALEDPNSDMYGLGMAWLIRLLIGVGLHVLFTGIAGYGLGIAMLRPDLGVGKRLTWGVGAFLAALTLHFLWNYDFGEAAALPMMVVVYVACVAGLVACWVHARRMARKLGPVLQM